MKLPAASRRRATAAMATARCGVSKRNYAVAKPAVAESYGAGTPPSLRQAAGNSGEGK